MTIRPSIGAALSAVSLGFALALTAAISATPAHATTFAPTTEDARIDAAELIVRGVVREIWSEEDHNGVIWTRAQVEVSRVYKGRLQERSVVVEQLGGTYAGRTMRVDGVARFNLDEEVVLMMDRAKSGNLRTVGMTMGKFTVRLDPYSRAELVQQFQVPLERPYDHRFLPLPAEGQRQTLGDLEARIQRRVEASK